MLVADYALAYFSIHDDFTASASIIAAGMRISPAIRLAAEVMGARKRNRVVGYTPPKHCWTTTSERRGRSLDPCTVFVNGGLTFVAVTGNVRAARGVPNA